MVEAAHASDEEVQDQSFLEVPAILDKFKAAAQIADGKQSLRSVYVLLCLFSLAEVKIGVKSFWNVWLTFVLDAMKKAISLAVVGADIYTVCQTVDAFIEDEVKKVFNSKKTKKLERGIAFPTCISVNHIVGHYSPLVDESVQLKEGDVAKIICGAHIDGYASNTAVTVVVGDSKVDGRKADVVLAAYHALKAAERVIRDQGTNQEVTEAISKVTAQYDCNAVEGVLSHTIKKYVIDGNNAIIGKETPT